MKTFEEIHREIVSLLKTQKGVTDVKDLFEDPNKYGNTVSHFSAKHSIKSEFNYSKCQPSIQWKTGKKSVLFIPDKGYFEIETAKDAIEVIKKHTKFK